MLPGGYGLGGDNGMGVVGGGDHDSVSLIEHLVEHHTVVIVLLGVRISLENMVSILPVDVAKSDDILGLHLTKVGGSTSSNTDTKNLKFLGRSHFFLLLVSLGGLSGHHDTRCYCQSGSHRCSLLKERAS